ncbi:class I SAM-dependent methyltransferase [Streptomyces sp. NPDC088387]|uniref:class I SAM-dependent methyltransferase n=1 Tax=Streptomyces sp. NPDC088387 TaxID=3365859 RepID=UPI0038114089
MTGDETRHDVWATAGPYERFMGRWSRLAARELATWLGLPEGLRWVDVGCGTGVLAGVVADRCAPGSLVGVDRSEGFVSTARATVGGGAHFVVADAGALPVRDGACDVSVSALTLNFLAQPAAGVAEMARVVRPGGTVAAYVWDYAGGMAFLGRFWDAAVAVDPSAAGLDERRRFAAWGPERLRELWAGAGLVDVATMPVEVPTVFTGFADLWEPFLAGQGPAPGYLASLSPAARDRVRTALDASLPRDTSGSVRLTARAWAVRGSRAGSRRGAGGR